MDFAYIFSYRDTPQEIKIEIFKIHSDRLIPDSQIFYANGSSAQRIYQLLLAFWTEQHRYEFIQRTFDREEI